MIHLLEIHPNCFRFLAVCAGTGILILMGNIILRFVAQPRDKSRRV